MRWHIVREAEDGTIEKFETGFDYKTICDRCARLNRRTHYQLDYYVCGKAMPVELHERKQMLYHDGEISEAIFDTPRFRNNSGDWYFSMTGRIPKKL